MKLRLLVACVSPFMSNFEDCRIVIRWLHPPLCWAVVVYALVIESAEIGSNEILSESVSVK